MRNDPLKGWQVDPKAIRYAGHDLQRPECILAERDGTLWSADARGGVMQIRPDGSQTLIAQPDPHVDIIRDAGKSLLGGTLPIGSGSPFPPPPIRGARPSIRGSRTVILC
jgi:gluconolactonase